MKKHIMVPFQIDDEPLRNEKNGSSETNLVDFQGTVCPTDVSRYPPVTQRTAPNFNSDRIRECPGVSGRILMNWPEAGDSC